MKSATRSSARQRLILAAVFFATAAYGQQGLDAGTLLRRISQEYRNAKYYRIEVQVVENSLNDEFVGQWFKSFQTAIVAPNGRYKIEAVGSGYSWVQVSNGTTEWVYNAATQEYVQNRTAPGGKPSRFGKSEWSGVESELISAQSIPEDLADGAAFALDPVFAGSQVLSLGTESVNCYLIRAKGRYSSGESPNTQLELTFWIDKSALTIRKIQEDWKGELTVVDPTQSSRTETMLYPVVELADPDVPQSLFEFQAPSAAKLVTDFKPVRGHPAQKNPGLVGSVAPQIKFQSSDGRDVSLSSFRSKPVLIEFWATWCGPCVEAFPKLEQLYAEAQAHGVVVITVDEDETPEKATAYFTAHAGPTWSNYHDNGEINRTLPGEGLPQFVLIDATGKVVFEASGFDEHELRSALAHLGTKFRALARKD